MCDGQARPSGVAEALTMLDRALDHLAAMDAASLPTWAQAEVLRALERAGAKHTATRGRGAGRLRNSDPVVDGRVERLEHREFSCHSAGWGWK
jgi:hypothetical protein